MDNQMWEDATNIVDELGEKYGAAEAISAAPLGDAAIDMVKVVMGIWSDPTLMPPKLFDATVSLAQSLAIDHVQEGFRSFEVWEKVYNGVVNHRPAPNPNAESGPQ